MPDLCAQEKREEKVDINCSSVTLLHFHKKFFMPLASTGESGSLCLKKNVTVKTPWEQKSNKKFDLYVRFNNYLNPNSS